MKMIFKLTVFLFLPIFSIAQNRDASEWELSCKDDMGNVYPMVWIEDGTHLDCPETRSHLSFEGIPVHFHQLLEVYEQTKIAIQKKEKHEGDFRVVLLRVKVIEDNISWETHYLIPDSNKTGKVTVFTQLEE